MGSSRHDPRVTLCLIEETLRNSSPSGGERWQRSRHDHRVRQSEAIAAAALVLIVERGASALNMASVATAAGVSRPTLYRYYPDLDALLVGVAELITSHDDRFEAHVLHDEDPRVQLDTLIGAVVEAGDHTNLGTPHLRTLLPPAARDVLDRHEEQILRLLADVLRAGIDDGRFRTDLDPSTDASLILGLASAADPTNRQRALTLVHRMVDHDRQETPT